MRIENISTEFLMSSCMRLAREEISFNFPEIKNSHLLLSFSSITSSSSLLLTVFTSLKKQFFSLKQSLNTSCAVLNYFDAMSSLIHTHTEEPSSIYIQMSSASFYCFYRNFCYASISSFVTLMDLPIYCRAKKSKIYDFRILLQSKCSLRRSAADLQVLECIFQCSL